MGLDKPAIPGQCCFELVSSHQQGIGLHVHVHVCTLYILKIHGGGRQASDPWTAEFVSSHQQGIRPTCLAHHPAGLYAQGEPEWLWYIYHHDSVFFMYMHNILVHVSVSKLNLRRESLETRHMAYIHAHVCTIILFSSLLRPDYFITRSQL